MPDQIPIHFNLAGEADRWGKKGTIFIAPTVLFLVVGSIYGFSKVPHYFHADKITKQDKEQFILLRKYLSAMNFIIILILFYMVWMSARNAHGRFRTVEFLYDLRGTYYICDLDDHCFRKKRTKNKGEELIPLH